MPKVMYRDDTERYLEQQGWLDIEPMEAPFGYHRGPVYFKTVTDAGLQAMKEAEQRWHDLRHADDAEFWFVEMNGGPGKACVVRCPAPEVAERALTEFFGTSTMATATRKLPDSIDLSGALNAFLDVMEEERTPWWRSFTGRPLGDPKIEFRVTAGLPPA